MICSSNCQCILCLELRDVNRNVTSDKVVSENFILAANRKFTYFGMDTEMTTSFSENFESFGTNTAFGAKQFLLNKHFGAKTNFGTHEHFGANGNFGVGKNCGADKQFGAITNFGTSQTFCAGENVGANNNIGTNTNVGTNANSSASKNLCTGENLSADANFSADSIEKKRHKSVIYISDNDGSNSGNSESEKILNSEVLDEFMTLNSSDTTNVITVVFRETFSYALRLISDINIPTKTVESGDDFPLGIEANVFNKKYLKRQRLPES